MNGKIKDLSRYSREDSDKLNLIREVYKKFPVVFKKLSKPESSFNKVANKSRANHDYVEDYDYDKKLEYVLSAPSLDEMIIEEDAKYCPECGRKYPQSENVCLDCLVHLKNISDEPDVTEIESNPQFVFEGANDFKSFDELLDEENLVKVNEFVFSYDDYSNILHDIKAQAFRNFDALIKENEIDFDGLEILEKIILFAKSFVKVEFKSSGGQLGYFEKDTIFIDERQTDSLQITTIIHELSHFLIQEILVHVICKILDASRSPLVEALLAFILSYTPFTELIDEYSAHNVEGRFTIFGFQDYSSYIQIEQSLKDEMSRDEIEITKSIGNNFALSIKEILEALIDKPLRKDIKDQFLRDTLDKPNYSALKMENCQILNDDGFIKAIWLILNDGCVIAASNIEKLEAIMDQ